MQIYEKLPKCHIFLQYLSFRPSGVLKRELKYNPKSYISVININDFSITMYSALPVYILKKVNDLERFKIDFKEDLQELPFSDEKEISILEFNAKVLPEIKKALRHIKRRQPQSFAIILTDSYALAKNKNEITAIIQEELVAVNLQKRCNAVDVLSSEQQSFYCFASFLQTTTYSPNSKNHPKDTDFFTKKGVHFCLDTTKLIATVFQGMDFSKTKNFDISLDQLAASINLSGSHSTRETFDKKLKHIEALFIGAFKDLAIDEKDIGIWIFSNGSLQENRRNYVSGYNPHRNKKLKKRAEAQGNFEWKNSVDDLKRDLFYDLPIDKEHAIKRIIYETFMYSIYKVYDIKNTCINRANVTVGYIYHLLEQLKNP